MLDIVKPSFVAAFGMMVATVVVALALWFLGVCLGVKLASGSRSRMRLSTTVSGAAFLLFALVAPVVLAYSAWALCLFGLWLLSAGAVLGVAIHFDVKDTDRSDANWALNLLSIMCLVTIGLCFGLLGNTVAAYAARPDTTLGERLPLILLTVEMLVALLNGFFAYGIHLRNAKARTQPVPAA